MKNKSYQPEKDSAGPPPIGSESGIADIKVMEICVMQDMISELQSKLDLANNQLTFLRGNNKLICNIAIIRGKRIQKMKEEREFFNKHLEKMRQNIEILMKERDDSYEKGYSNGLKEISNYRYTLEGELIDISKLPDFEKFKKK